MYVPLYQITFPADTYADVVKEEISINVDIQYELEVWFDRRKCETNKTKDCTLATRIILLNTEESER